MAARPLHFAHDKRRRPYWRDERLLGKTYLDRQSEHVLIIGKDSWSRQQMVDDLHCGHLVAAQNLSRLAAKLQVDSLEQLIARFTLEDLLQERGVGLTTVIVLMHAQEARNKNPLSWIDRKPDEIVTLATEQHRARKQQIEARRSKRAKTRAARTANAPAMPAAVPA